MEHYVPKQSSFYVRSKSWENRLLPSSCLSVCLYDRMKQLDSRWKDFYEIWYLSIPRKYVEKIQISLNFDKNNEYCT
jgi:hypothetical protein